MQNQPSAVHIRPAQPAEAPQLTRLALQSKAYWRYDDAFMAACHAELTVTPERIAAQPTYVLIEQEKLCGFYMLDRDRTPLVELDFLFVSPAAIGRGYWPAPPQRPVLAPSTPCRSRSHRHFILPINCPRQQTAAPDEMNSWLATACTRR
jgi:hypothetical protein